MRTHREGLLPPALEPLSLGSLLPEGWLATQLAIQAAGLSGHLADFWPDVAASGWIGGDAEGWERGPYWLDGMVPLAFLLRDETLIARVRHWMDEILARQSPDGWLGPRQDAATGRYQPLDPWPVAVFIKAAMQFHDATGDERIVPALTAYYRRLTQQLDEVPLFDWGRMRWPDLVLGVHWLHDLTGDPWLLSLARTIRHQGYDWDALFADYPYTGRTGPSEISMSTHVVNNAMALKGGCLHYRQSHDPVHLRSVWRMMALLDAYHGQVSGVFSGDEHLAGRDPRQGTELCAVVEYMYSLEVLLSLLGDADMADRVERIAYNALPAAFKPDMWAHQYDQQANQPVCQVVPKPVYTNNAPESNIYGLEPNYGCCTANMHQGWPKFAANLWMRLPAQGAAGEGLVALSYAPCTVTTRVAGVGLQVRVTSEYPFEGRVSITVHADAPVRFPLMLRIPRWAEGAVVTLEGAVPETPQAGRYHCITRLWEADSTLTLELPLALRVETRYHGSASILCGPLVMALAPGERWEQIGGTLPHADWEVYPTTPWNYALALDRGAPERSIRVARRAMGAIPFSPEGVPLTATVRGGRVAGWTIEQGTAGPLPPSPVTPSGPLTTLMLIPYGATNLRIAEFPTLPPATEAQAADTPAPDATP